MSKAKGASRGRIHASERSAVSKARARGFEVLRRGDLGEVAFLHKAMSLGLVVAEPRGRNHSYDFIIEGEAAFRSVQVKTCARMWHGLYRVCIRHRKDSVAVAYTESEVDFVAVYIIPLKTWYILPVREVVGHTNLSFRPKGHPRGDPYSYYREAWHLLREPDGLTFG
jgi:hypothetical protein